MPARNEPNMTPAAPPWLPGTISVGGDWDAVRKALYEIFRHDFAQGECEFQGRPVWWNRSREEDDPHEEGFWHLITSLDQGQNERLFEPRRAERLPWCKPTIVNSFRAEVTVWDYQEASGRIRTYLWLKDWDYVVVLEKTKLCGGRDIAFLITAFYVSGNQTRRTLQRKFEARVR
jgi:hypothetical protein